MSELSQRLKAVVDQRFGGVARQASRAAGLHENAVMRVLEGGPHLPNLETLDKMATAYGWDLGAVCFWALDRPVPPLEDGPADAVIQKILAREGYSELTRKFIQDVLERARPQQAQIPSTE